MTTDDDRTGSGTADAVEQLLRMAGPREMPSALGRHAARVAVREAWRERVRARTRRRWIVAGLPALAAAAALIVAVASWRTTPVNDARPVLVARVVAATSPATVERGGSTRALAIGDVVQAGDRVETAAGAVVAFAIEGGGELRQNGATTSRWTALRELALVRGEVYFDSGRVGRGAPIAVDTVAGRVRDIGTRFEVRVRGDDVRVRVREGVVRIESKGAAREAVAGRVLETRPGGGIEERAAPTFGDDWDWIIRASVFRLERATLRAFIDWVEAESGRDVEFRPASLRGETAAVVLHGSVAGLSLDAALGVVLPAAGLTHRVDGERIIVERAGQEPRR